MACAVAGRLVPSSAAEDVAHDALLEVFESLGDVRQPFALPLLVRLAVRKHADRTRRAQGRHPVIDDADETADPAVLAERSQLVATVRAALQTAPEPDRYLLELRYLAEWSTADLATATGLTEGAVRKRLHDARRRLRPRLAARDLTPPTRRPPVPDPTAFLGHLYLADGTAADAAMSPLLGEPALPTLDSEPSMQPNASEALSVGIKAVDAFAPLVRGGRHDLVGPFGTGHLVLAREIVARANRSRATACVAVGSRHWHKGGFSNVHKFAGESNPEAARFVTIVGSDESDATAAIGRAARLVYALAEHRDVIVVVDDFVATHATATLDAVQRGITSENHAVTVLHLDPYGEGFDASDRPQYDGRLVLSLELAARGLFPAIDPELSRSALLADDTPDAARVRNARAVLAAARELRTTLAQGLVGEDDERNQWVDPTSTLAEIDRIIVGVTGSAAR